MLRSLPPISLVALALCAFGTFASSSPSLNNPGTTYELIGADTFRISTADRHVWQLQVTSSSGPYQLVAGQNQAQHWAPLPGIQCYPLAIRIDMAAAGSYTIRYTVKQTR